MLKVNLFFFGIVFVFMAILLIYNETPSNSAFTKYDTKTLKLMRNEYKRLIKRLDEKIDKDPSDKKSVNERKEIKSILVNVEKELKLRKGVVKYHYGLLGIGIFLILIGISMVFKDRFLSNR